MTRAIAAASARSTIDMRRGGFARALSLALSTLMGFAIAGCTSSARDIEPIQVAAVRKGNARNVPIVDERSTARPGDIPVATSDLPTPAEDVCLVSATRTIALALKQRFDLSIGRDPNTQPDAASVRVATNTLRSRLPIVLRRVPQLVAEQIRDWVLKRVPLRNTYSG